MRQLSEMVCSGGQLYVPPSFPHALKLYAKAAIRTQPYDLLVWSAAYFRALADGKRPPAKARLEYPLLKTERGLTQGYVKLVVQQFAGVEPTAEEVRKQWKNISLDEYEFDQICCLAGVYHPADFAFYKFIATAAGFVTKSLTQTMIALCELYTDEPDGGSAAIPSPLFIRLYAFLASIDASKQYRYLDGRLWDSKEEDESAQTQTVSDDSGLMESFKDVSGGDTMEVFRESTTDDNNVATNTDSSSDEQNMAKQQSSETTDDDHKSMESIVKSLDHLTEKSLNMHHKAEMCIQDIQDGKAAAEKPVGRGGRSAEVNPEAKGVVNPVIKGLFDSVTVEMGKFFGGGAAKMKAIVVPPVPGVGPVVDKKISDAFVSYVREKASEQRDAFMPRNIRHYLCPPLQKL